MEKWVIWAKFNLCFGTHSFRKESLRSPKYLQGPKVQYYIIKLISLSSLSVTKWVNSERAYWWLYKESKWTKSGSEFRSVSERVHREGACRAKF